MTINRAIHCLLMLTLLATSAHAERVGIAAIVNDDIITTNDVIERRDLLLESNRIPPTPQNLARFTPRVIESLIDETLQMQEAKRLSIAVKPEEVDAAIRQMEESRRAPAGTLRASLTQQGLSVRSLEDQLRAQIAWNKVVQRKLRREVSIAQDEVARAQAAAAADPGVPEVRIAAISVIVADPAQEAAQAALAQSLGEQLQAGVDMGQLAVQLADRKDVRISPPGWVEEEKLQPAMQQAIRGLQPGQTTPPLKSLNTYQIIQLMERRVAKQLPDRTEVMVKEIVLPLPSQPTKQAMLQLRDAAMQLQANPGTCLDTTLPTPSARASFMRVTLNRMPGELRSLVSNLGVGETSQPMLGEDAVRLFMLCERIEPAQGNMPPAAEVRRKLYNEKIELEAQKHLRNLKRDAFIEIKQPQAGDDA